MKVAILLVFGASYLLIAGRRWAALPIGRPAGALLGATAMVALGALTPAASYAAIDHDTILLLCGMMLLTVHLEQAGFFGGAADLLLRSCRSATSLLVAVAGLSAGLSALLVNDTVCVFFTPLVITACRRARLPLGPYLIALATSANIGSAATLVGNPQNMIIGSMSQLSFTAFFLRSLPAAAAGLVVNVVLLLLWYRRRLPAGPLVLVDLPPAEERPPAPDRRQLALATAVLGAMVVGFVAGLHMGYTAVAGALVLVIASRRDAREALARVDWSLLLFFCALFVVVAGLNSTGLIEQAWRAAAPGLRLGEAAGLAKFTALLVAGSNLVSNVPMVLLTGPHLGELGAGPQGWVLLAFVTTVAGNLTLVGSVANLIVAELARDHYRLGFREYLRFGLVSTAAVLAVGVTILVLLPG